MELPFALIKPAQVLLVQSSTWLGALIMRATDSPWTHAALIEGAKHDEVLTTIEAADLDGVRHCRLQEDYVDNPGIRGMAIYDDPTLTMDERWAICEYAETLNGRPYDTDQLIGIYLRKKLPGTHLDKNRLDSEEELICSELVARSWIAGANRRNILPPGVGVGCVAPGDFPGTLTKVWEWWKEVPNENPHVAVVLSPDPPTVG